MSNVKEELLERNCGNTIKLLTSSQRRVYSRVMLGFIYSGEYLFITLTSRLAFDVNNIPRLKYDWSKLRKRFRRKYDMDYIWAIGRGHIKDLLHVHIIVRMKADFDIVTTHNWLSRQWHKIHGCYQIDVEPAYPDEVSSMGYTGAQRLASYMSKNVASQRYCWGKSRQWIEKRSWRQDMRNLIREKTYEYFSSPEGKEEYQHILLAIDNEEIGMGT